MILHSLTLHNFGIYGGEHRFVLTPQSNGRFQQPIILLRGQNGVGKSTFMEAIRLGLHGRLSLGNRTMQKEYEVYLESRLHRRVDGTVASVAVVEMEFDHVFLGQRHRYRLLRSWSKQNQRLTSELQLWVDDKPGPESEEEREHLLRELISPGVAELFFFDGEKINTLSDAGDASDALLAETVKNLLGLHLVGQLDRDLDYYLTRQTGIQELQQYQNQLAQLSEETTTLEQQHQDVLAMLTDCRHRYQAKRETITLLEERIAREGGQYAAAQSAHNDERQKILAALAQTEQEIQELSRSLLPFVVAPNLLVSVRERLQREAAFEQWQAAQPLVTKLQSRLLQEPGAVYHVNEPDSAPAQNDDFVGYVRQVVTEFSQPPLPETEIVHRVSGEKRGVLLNWIDEALTTTPQQVADVLQRRELLQNQLATVDESLRRVPSNQMLQPLQDDLRQHDRELGRLEAEQERLTAEEKRLTFHLERLAGSRRRVGEQMANINTEEHRIKLAARTKGLLDKYQQQLIANKLAQFTTQLSKRFNQLIRKRHFVDQISIDPHSFTLSLYRAGKLFPRAHLSAGEEQILAIATLWALREVSGRPLPVIIDTPLSRLDADHRRTMLAEFMPQVAQQVIVLATTTEIDDPTFHFLQPAISRAYLLEADSNTTHITEQSLIPPSARIGIDQIVAHAIQ